MQGGDTLDWAGEPLDELAARVRQALALDERVTVRLARHFPTSITEQAFADEMAAVRQRLDPGTGLRTERFVAIFARPPSFD